MIRDQIGVPIEPALLSAHEQLLASVRAALGEETFTTAWSAAQALSVETAIDEARLLLSSPAPPTSSAAPRSALPGGLSEREADVLRLIAAGLTNAQAADRLFISRRTVDAHLRRIYDKIGVASRSQAVRFALAHDLV